MTELQQQVFDLAKSQLSEYSWYRGVCMDNFPTDAEIERDGMDYAVDSVCFETAYWDSDMMSSK